MEISSELKLMLIERIDDLFRAVDDDNEQKKCAWRTSPGAFYQHWGAATQQHLQRGEQFCDSDELQHECIVFIDRFEADLGGELAQTTRESVYRIIDDCADILSLERQDAAELQREQLQQQQSISDRRQRRMAQEIAQLKARLQKLEAQLVAKDAVEEGAVPVKLVSKESPVLWQRATGSPAVVAQAATTDASTQTRARVCSV